MIKIAACGLFLAVLACVWTDAEAQTMEELDTRIAACTTVLKNVLDMPDRGIPKDLLQRCRGLAIFPGVLKVGVLVGVSYGNGVILRRDEKTGIWSRPAFFSIKGGSFGLQVGAQSVDLILLIMSERGVQNLLEDRMTLGADIAVTAGPVGREASAETNLRFDAGILSYSRTRGLFAGLALTGAVLEPDSAANAVYHGKDVSVQDVFYEGRGTLSDDAGNLMRMVEEATQ
jgi:lipid-binding SYLF domain-containing protein